MKTYSVRVGVVEDAMAREILKKQPGHQEVTWFLEKMIAQKYKKMFPNSGAWSCDSFFQVA